LTTDHPKAKEIIADAPQSISFLSEQSRTQFKEVLEYLETLDITYRINPALICNRNYSSETVFVIRQADTEDLQAPYALGVRYNGLAKKIGLKKDVPSARVIIQLPKAKMELLKTVPKKQPKPKFFFIQIGFEAKIKSLKVVEMLRQENIPLAYSLIKDKLTMQLLSAEQMQIPYILLMGQKESMEETVLVRNMKNSSQETVPIKDLVKYLKKLK
jgi:histidyl-tRNA synthetase